MKIKIFRNIKNINFNYKDFPSNYNFLLVTGLSGSGKSTEAEILAKNYNAKVITLDGLSEIYKSKKINDATKDLIYKFIGLNPKIKDELKDNFWHQQKLNNFKKYKYWNNLFFEFLIENISKEKQNFIIEGTQIFMTVEPNKIKKCPIIIMGTSDIKSFFRRIKRQINKNDLKHPFSKGLKHLTKLVKDSKRLHYIDYKKLNEFISSLK